MRASFFHHSLTTLGAMVVLFGIAEDGEASIIINFVNGDSFDGDVAGDTSALFTDPDTGQSGFIQTRAVAPNGELNTRANGGLGIRASTGRGGRFDNGEGWTFDWSLDTSWEGISFGAFIDGSESFTVSSAAFQGLSIAPTASEVSFDSGAGAFTFASTGQTSFDLNDLTGGSQLALSSGVDLSITYANPLGRRADVGSLTFGTTQPVPEPGTVVLLVIGAAFLVGLKKLRLKNGEPMTDSMLSQE